MKEQEAFESKKKIITLEAPEKYEPGHPIYQQPPFTDIFAQWQLKFPQLTDKALSFVISRIALDQKAKEENEGKQSISEHEVKGYLKKNKITGVNAKETYVEIERFLSEYPLWQNYVNRLLNTVYKPDGLSLPQAKEPLPLDSYAAWVTNQLQLDTTLKLVGLEEVIPAGFERNAYTSPGKIGGRKRYQILRASELTKIKTK